MEPAKLSGVKFKLALAGLLAAGLFAAWAASAGAASVPAVPVEPQAQIDATAGAAAGCTAVLTNVRLIRVRRNSYGYMTARLFEQTWVDRCPVDGGGTEDRNTRRVQVWQDW